MYMRKLESDAIFLPHKKKTKQKKNGMTKAIPAIPLTLALNNAW